MDDPKHVMVPPKNPDIRLISEIAEMVGIDFPFHSIKIEFDMKSPVISVQVGFYPSLKLKNQG